MQVENGSAKAAGNLFGLASARDSHGGEWTKRALKQSVASVRMAAFERMTERPLLAAFCLSREAENDPKQMCLANPEQFTDVEIKSGHGLFWLSNWLFAGTLRSGKGAAAIISLNQSARLNIHEPYAYLKGVLTRLPTQRASEVDQLLPHKWQPVSSRKAWCRTHKPGR